MPPSSLFRRGGSLRRSLGSVASSSQVGANLRRRLQSLLRTESGRRTAARIRREGTLPPEMAHMLGELLREAEERAGRTRDETDGLSTGAVQNMKEVSRDASTLCFKGFPETLYRV